MGLQQTAKLRVTANLLGYFLVMLLAGLLWRSPIALCVVYALYTLALFWRGRRADLLYFIVPAILGPLGEILAILGGAWTYAKPAILVPIWLPLAWGCAAVLIKRAADNVVESAS